MKSSILVAVCVVLSYIGIGYFYNENVEESNTVMEEYKKQDRRNDSLITAYEHAFEDMNDEISLLIIEKEFFRGGSNKSLAIIQELTKPVVTAEVIDESLLWVKRYNDSSSLSPSSRQYSRVDSVRRR